MLRPPVVGQAAVVVDIGDGHYSVTAHRDKKSGRAFAGRPAPQSSSGWTLPLPAAAAATATAAAVAAAATAAAAGLTRARLVHGHGAARQVLAIHRLDRGVGLIGGHRHEPKAFRPAGLGDRDRHFGGAK